MPRIVMCSVLLLLLLLLRVLSNLHFGYHDNLASRVLLILYLF